MNNKGNGNITKNLLYRVAELGTRLIYIFTLYLLMVIGRLFSSSSLAHRVVQHRNGRNPRRVRCGEPLPRRARLVRRHTGHSAHACGCGTHVEGHKTWGSRRANGDGARFRSGHSGKDSHQRRHGRLSTGAVPGSPRGDRLFGEM